MAKGNDKEKRASRARQRRYYRFKVGFEGKPSDQIEMRAYAFDPQGNLMAEAPVEDGLARLSLTTKQAKEARLYFAPAPPEGEAEDPAPRTLESMGRLRAYEPAWRFDPKQRTYELLEVPEVIWQWWLYCACRVRGRVVRPVEVEGVTYEMPVCNARVHVCEVDRLWWVIERLPDPIIWRVRDELLEILRRPEPIPDPLPDPPFRFDPGVIDPSPIELARMNYEHQAKKAGRQNLSARMFNPQPEPPAPERFIAAAAPPNPTPKVPERKALEANIELIDLPSESLAALHAPSANLVRQALLDHIYLIYPYLCWWDWLWPYFYTCDEVAVLTTNHDGVFDGTFWYLCGGDQPDLYFWVEYNIGGTWTTVYHPPIRCNTYWNYECGSEVTLRVTDPRVPWCGGEPPLPGKQLAVLTIGKNVSMTEIQREGALVNEGLTSDGRPFGGSLEPHVWFGDNLISSGITHYRWSYRRAGTAEAWTAIDEPVSRHYAEVMPDDSLVFKPYLLGPDPSFPGDNLYQIPPEDPPLVAPAVSTSWAPQVNPRTNAASAFFKSHTLAGGDAELGAGKYELKLELFHSDGSLVNLSSEGVKLKVPTIDAPFGTNTVVPTREVPLDPPDVAMEDRVIRDLGTGDVMAFRLVLHVDNNPCYAEIEEVTVGGTAAGPCGFLQYPPGANVHVSFIARHPNNFATFSFNIYKGSSGSVVSASGSVGAAVVNGFVRDVASRFSKDIPVADLVGTCPGGKAAFSETLHVDAMATDGWHILQYLDRNATPKAFALEPVLAIAESP